MKKYNIPKSTWTRFKTNENPEPEPISDGFGISVESPFGVPDVILRKLLGERLRVAETPPWVAIPTPTVERIRVSESRAWGAVPAPETSIFNGLEEDFPNFQDVIGTIRTFSLASRLRPGLPLRFPPLLLLGPPGLGKTEFVFELCERLCTPFYQVPCSSNSGGSMALAGSDERWSNGSPGLILKTFLREKVVNPVLVLDEIDKAPQMSMQAASVHDVLLSLLEERTSRAFVDEYIGPELPFDASRVNWLATANSLELIPEPLLSRFRIFEIGPFPEIRLPDLVSRILKKIVEGLGLEGAVRFCVRDEAIESLQGRTAREIRQALEGAVARRLVDIPEGFAAGARLVLRTQDFERECKTVAGVKIGFRR